MKKIILYITILLMALTKVASSQVATIQTVAGTCGSMTVDVTLNGFTASNTMGAMTMYIAYNPNAASFTGITYVGGGMPNNSIIANAAFGVITLAWSDPNGLPINGLGFKLNFNYSGGNTNLIFSNSNNLNSEIANNLGSVIQTTFIDGAITQPVFAATATIANQAGQWGIVNELPVTFSGFTNSAGALSLNLTYDKTKLQFINLNAPALSGAIVTASNGVIHIEWSSATAVNLNSILFKLNFNYLGGVSTVNFTNTNSISDALGNPICVTLYNGGITQAATTTIVDIADNITPVAGIATVPVTFTNFTSNQGAVTMHIAYNNSKLSFLGTSGLVGFTGLTANAVNGIITLSWANQNGASISGFNLSFNYIGGATCPINFTGLNQITDINGNLIAVNYTNGNVIQAAVPDVTVSLGNVASSSTLLIPLTITGTLNKNISATDFKITYDYTKLTYTGITNVAKSGIIANLDLATHTILISWANLSSPITADGKFLDLQFTYNGGPGNCVIPVVFTTFNASASSLADINSMPVMATWKDGNVNPVVVNAKVILKGAYNTVSNLMNTTLRTKAYFPKNQPYNVAPWNYSGTESVVTVPVNVVDWVLVELRSGTAAATTVAKRAGFLLNDGSIVDLDGTSSLVFPSVVSGNYYIVVRHRNHLAVMSASSQAISCSSASYDFTSAVNMAYGSPNPAIFSSGKAMMILGDVNSNGTARATGPAAVNDLNLLQTYTGISVLSIYSTYDVNLDGVARSTGPASVNDGSILSAALGITIYTTKVPN